MLLNNWTNTRDFIYISDVCNLIHKMMVNFESGIFNVGTSKGTSIYELAVLIAKNLKLDESSIIRGTIEEKDVSNIVLDISNTTKKFNWKPKIDIDLGVKLLLRGVNEKIKK